MRSLLTTATILLLLAVPLSVQSLLAQEKNPATLSQEQLEAIAIQPASNWGTGAQRVIPEMLALFKEESIQFNGKTMKFRLHCPEFLTAGKEYPMILWLHGAGEVGDDNKSQLIHLHHIITSLTGEKKRDFFLLVPQEPQYSYSWGTTADLSAYEAMRMSIPADVKSGKKTLEAYKEELTAEMKDAFGDSAEVTVQETTAIVPVTRSIGGVFGFGAQRITDTKEEKMLSVSVKRAFDHPLDFAFAMVEQVAEKYPVDKNRITVSGLSTGGDGTWQALERRPDLFAAGVPLANWIAFSDKAMEESPILKKIPVWSIYSSDDNGIDRARAEFARAEKAGANVKKTEFGICGHTAWTPAMLQADIFAWLLSRAKDGDRYYAVYDPGVDPDAMKGIIDVATRDTTKPTLAPAVEKQSVGTLALFAATPTMATPIMSHDQFYQIAEARERAITMALPGVETPGYTTQVLGTADDISRINTMMATAQAQPMGQTVMEEFMTPDGVVHQRLVTRPVPVIAPSPERDHAYATLAIKYFEMAQQHQQQVKAFEMNQSMGGPIPEHLVLRLRQEQGAAYIAFIDTFKKISPEVRVQMIPPLIEMAEGFESLRVLEALLDGIQPTIPGAPTPPRPVPMPVRPAQPRRAADVSPPVPTISAEKIIEECNRPWAMTSESLYGMFPADWGKEAEAIPDFIVNSDSDALSKRLAKSVSEDAESKEFVAACRSILSLTNKPMSSPWFDTSGGRLRSEIQYTLSQRGEMFVRFLRVVADSGGNSDKAKELSIVAKKTLEKIEMVLGK